MKLEAVVVVDSPLTVDIIGCIRYIPPIRARALEEVLIDSLLSSIVYSIFKDIATEPADIDYDALKNCFDGVLDMDFRLEELMTAGTIVRLIDLLNELKKDITEVILVDSYYPKAMIEASIMRNSIITIKMFNIHPIEKVYEKKSLNVGEVVDV